MFDVVIIGSGAAGLTTALNVDSNLNVLILTADSKDGANTKLAQGGIAASWKPTAEQIKSHIEDTMIAGSNANDLQAVTNLIESSSSAIDFLIDCGTNFDKCGDDYDLTSEGAHSMRRIFHAQGDSTGRVIYESLLNKVVKSSNISIIDNANCNKLEELSAQTYKLYFEQNNIQKSITTNNLVIASGGYGSLYTASTNTKWITGTSVILANQVDAAIESMHLIQFHPTGYRDNNGKYHLLTESLRGEGARIYSPQSGYFMTNYHSLGDVAPRDITSRAVQAELDKGNEVYLDCSSLCVEGSVYERFQTVSACVAQDGRDLCTDFIPIRPVAHYSIGGIKVDANSQSTKQGLYAVGEASSTGVHGANRLASNSLLECVVYGISCGNHITKQNSYQIETEDKQIDKVSEQTLNTIQGILNKYCNITRNDQQLQLAREQLSNINGNSSDQGLITLATKIIDSCIEHPSIGCHFKENNE
ncbi:FAD-dependent oxidoreductase [Mollicutes bacterium LVI A0078]|nr:FAD-dependent oxidoreductase [Mollicutes bacterium LVI A0075]WOO91755.1 FAD-dependent oxidoreductase [Mollicutes bacterium LVI A0078]